MEELLIGIGLGGAIGSTATYFAARWKGGGASEDSSTAAPLPVEHAAPELPEGSGAAAYRQRKHGR